MRPRGGYQRIDCKDTVTKQPPVAAPSNLRGRVIQRLARPLTLSIGNPEGCTVCIGRARPDELIPPPTELRVSGPSLLMGVVTWHGTLLWISNNAPRRSAGPLSSSCRLTPRVMDESMPGEVGKPPCSGFPTSALVFLRKEEPCR